MTLSGKENGQFDSATTYMYRPFRWGVFTKLSAPAQPGVYLSAIKVLLTAVTVTYLIVERYGKIYVLAVYNGFLIK